MNHRERLYRIEVRGSLDAGWSDWFEGMTVEASRDAAGSPITVISGPVEDQAALQGILTRIWNLNLPVLAVTCLLGYGRHPDSEGSSAPPPEGDPPTGS